MKNNYLFQAMMVAALCGAVLMASCSSPVEKAEKIQKELPKDAVVISTNLTGENPNMVVCEPTEEGYAVTLRSVNDGKVDTLLTAGPENEPCEVVRVDGGYLVVQRGNEGYQGAPELYYASIIRDGTHSEKEDLYIDDEAQDLGADSYVIDRSRKQLTLSGYVNNGDEVKVYATAYDFTGRHLASEPKIIKMAPKRSESDGAMYLWECNICGKKVNSRNRPKSMGFFDDCTRNFMEGGHAWVKIQRVD